MTSGFSLFPSISNSNQSQTKPIQRIMGISILLLFTLFFTYIAAMMAAIIGLGFNIDDSDVVRRMLTTPSHSAININFLRWTNFFQSIISLGIPAVIVTYLVGWNLQEVGNYNRFPIKKSWLWGFLIALILTPFVSVINQGSEWLFNRIFPFSVLQTFQSLNANRQQIIEATLDMETWGELGVCVLILAWMPAMLEEYVFRGLITKFAANHFSNSITTGIFQALVFSLIHFSPYEFFGIFVAGLLLGSIRMHTQSLWLSTWVHFLFNATAIILHFYTLQHFNSTGIYIDTNHWFTNPYSLGIIVILAPVLLFICIRKIALQTQIA